MNYRTQYGGSLGTPEKNKTGEILVETAGYISAKERITNIMLAGQRLENYRKGRFDFDDEKSVDPDFHDPTRDPGFDMADASQMTYAVNSRLEAQKKASEEALRASQTAPEAPDGASGAKKVPEPDNA